VRFDILKHLGVVHKCYGQTGGQTEPSLAIARSNDPR